MKFLKFLVPMLAISFFTACEEEDDTGEVPDNNPCPNDTEFCMEIAGQSLSGDAELEDIGQNHYRINFVSHDAAFQELEMNIYGSAPGDYQIDTTGQVGTASFEYYSDTLNAVVYGVEGNVKVTEFEENDVDIGGLSGDFHMTLNDGMQITNGHFNKVDEEQ